MIYKFSLPWPPTVNHFHIPIRLGKHARCIKSPDVKKYQIEVARVMAELGLSGLMITEKVLISLVLHPKTNHKYDCSNFLKAYEDGLEKCGFIENDCQIEYSSIRKGEKVKGGRLDIIVRLNEKDSYLQELENEEKRWKE